MIAAKHITIPIQNIGEWWIRLQSRPWLCGFIRFTSRKRFSHEWRSDRGQHRKRLAGPPQVQHVGIAGFVLNSLYPRR